MRDYLKEHKDTANEIETKIRQALGVGGKPKEAVKVADEADAEDADT